MNAIQILNQQADEIRNTINAETDGSFASFFKHPLYPALDAISKTIVKMAMNEGMLKPISYETMLSAACN